ncbi:uncharacterized membrane protein YgdD (TMEM256/DUF423 family) [Algoriphagus ratkowskyi]|uniref:DUF423 domain-containing protein n=1 Tax=Algoriphagus ratkowskyi TaxID=57028 RepID=A0A2W7QVY1_9BACT|nr:DUF423 domain-containing protein [Algoriphagus ratkowskyi]PZX50280.1 uncharacterized membrane protein YgdD (TMEM256/DUF423 family) [Algoriphagus ratkowskyi]TXD75630.1 DUF423 domain-containing protein [Algoriphagus ratkowskyi]
MNGKQIIQTAAIFGAVAVGIGAFGAHGLKDILADTGKAETFETAVKYHFYHSLALFLIGILALIKPTWNKLSTAAILMVVGILIFSGSLYFLSLTGITWLGAITPLGGVAFIAGWILVFLAASTKSDL